MAAEDVQLGTWQTSSNLRWTEAGDQVGSETWLTVSKVRELLRCQSCKAKGRRTLIQRTETTTYHAGYMAPRRSRHTRFVVVGQVVPYPRPTCPGCGSARVRASVVEGRLDRNRPCDGRCMGATGPRCECSCGGENHGGRYDEWG